MALVRVLASALAKEFGLAALALVVVLASAMTSVTALASWCW
jgi:hypothetical protein